MNLGWLKTAGKIAAQVGAAAAGIDLKQFVPDAFKPIVGKIDAILEKSHLGEIGDAILRTETISNRLAQPLPGPEKLAATAPDVVAVLKDFLTIRNIKIANPVEFDAASKDLTSAMVRMFNACEEHGK